MKLGVRCKWKVGGLFGIVLELFRDLGSCKGPCVNALGAE